jgi:hypothetical protein
MHFISSPVPEAPGVAQGDQRECSGEADLLCQLAPGRYFRRLTVPDSAAGEVPLDPIRRAHQQYRLTDVDSHKRSLMLLVPQSPPDAGKRETDAVCCPPGSVEKRGTSSLSKV